MSILRRYEYRLQFQTGKTIFLEHNASAASVMEGSEPVRRLCAASSSR